MTNDQPEIIDPMILDALFYHQPDKFGVPCGQVLQSSVKSEIPAPASVGECNREKTTVLTVQGQMFWLRL